ncbi:3-beta hydroxysteroid dehydrogenase [Actinoplanes sp. OR16]|uniref:NAD(P)-dependent oxidoreductase n=1 Tax=Actinoplanes sp. OR16 TaxID=946334 RepID=UPI000F6EBE75|nr:NAD(P)H-binding protein [Actinoplanes sp. OR16]BBH67426.1 3-beta hydroxysteroid dehydrogenase [Actinoplanes sp. OR16]
MSEIAIFGANGRAGRAVAAEAVRRGHQVTAVVRDPSAYEGPTSPAIHPTRGDVTDPGDITAGHDAVVSAVFDGSAEPRAFYTTAAKALLAAGPRRLIVVGLSSILATADGTPLMDTPGYPQEYRAFSEAHAAGAEVLAGSEQDWLIVSPAGDFDHAGGRTGRYRVTTADAASRISYPDLAVAVLDEIERPAHRRTHLGLSG